jgi:low temperature requirement protein LtrA
VAHQEVTPDSQVSTIELFFDLVFVFTITQLTSLLTREPNIGGLLQGLLIFGNVWWMYGGYAWLTNAVPPRDVITRLYLLLGMAGFLLIALAIPTTFSGGGVVFGIGYLVVSLVHTRFFMRVSQQSVRSAMRTLGPFNLITAGLLLVAGFTPPLLREVLFALGFVLHWITPFLIEQGAFNIRAGHFVERHGLIVLIALGESIVAVGIGLGFAALPLGRIITAVLGLALTAGLWWLYFNGDERRAEQALSTATGDSGSWLALNAFGYTFLPLLGGIVLFAAGLKIAVVEYLRPENIPTALFLAGGVALYAFGLGLFRYFIGVRPGAARIAIIVLGATSALLGVWVSALAQVVALVVIVAAAAYVESRENAISRTRREAEA